MKFIAHRVNTIDDLKKVPEQYGIESDIRDYGDKIVLNHDPFKRGEDLEQFLGHYNHSTMILNIKSESIEFRVLELIQKHNISDYFFLDSSFPMIYQLSQLGEKNIAIRYSEFETIETVLAMKGRADWVWVDCFSRLPLNHESCRILKDADFKICLVSPELQGRENDIEEYRLYLDNENIKVDAVCTKLYNICRWNG